MIDQHHYEEENSGGYGDYDDVVGGPHIKEAERLRRKLEDYGKAFMRIVGREIAKEREAIALARANGEFNDGEAGQSPMKTQSTEISI